MRDVDGIMREEKKGNDEEMRRMDDPMEIYANMREGARIYKGENRWRKGEGRE